MPINLSSLNRLTHKHSQADRQKTQDNNLKIKNLNLCVVFLQAKNSNSVLSGFSIEYSSKPLNLKPNIPK